MRVSSPTMVGRGAEMDRFAELMRRLPSEGAHVVTVSGDAGVGKSRLMASLTERARSVGYRVLTGGCLDIAEGLLPLGAVNEALRPLWSEFDPAAPDAVMGAAGPALAALGLAPVGGPVGGAVGGPVGGPVGGSGGGLPAVGLGRVLEDIRALLDRLAATAPVVVVLEDIHWADRATRDLLLYLSRNLTGPLLLAATYRAEEPHHRPALRALLAELHRNRRCEHLRLAPLAPTAVAEMVGEIMGFAPPVEIVDQIVTRAEGNAFFAEELLAAHRQGSALPETLHTVLAARLDPLPAGSRRMLGLLATLGGPVGHEILAALMDPDEDALLGLLRAAVDGDVLTVDADGRSYRFRHALFRELAYDELLPVERADFHQRCALVLAAEPVPAFPAERAAQAGAVAFHWHRAGDPYQTLLWSAKAASAAQAASSPGDATRQYQRVLALWDKVPGAAAECGMSRDEVVRATAATAHLAGDYRTAIDLLTAELAVLIPGENPLCASEYLEAIGYCQVAGGDQYAAEAAYSAAADVLSDQAPCPQMTRALAGRAHMLLLRDRNAIAADIARSALDTAARAAGEPATTCRALTVLGSALANLGEISDGLAALERAIAESDAGGDPSTLIWALGAIADVQLQAGRAAAAIEPARRALVVARSLGAARNYGAWFATAAAEALLCQGEIPAAQAELDALLALDLPRGVRRRPLVALARLRLVLGDIRAARDAVEEALAPAPEQFTAALYADACAVRAHVATAQGRFDDARSAVADGLAGCGASDGPGPIVRLCGAGLAAESRRVAAARSVGTAEDHGTVSTIAERLIRRARDANPTGQMLRASAELAGAEAEHASITGAEGQAQAWHRAVAGWDDIGFGCAATYARYRYAQASLTAGAVGDGVPALRRAHHDAVRLGAGALATTIAELARHARVDLPPSAAQLGDDAGGRAQGGLTDREQQVLDLLTEGMTNRSIARALFISEKTVSVHVTHILAKLAVTNRGQAAAIGRRSTGRSGGSGP